jgi:hypothetical protein
MMELRIEKSISWMIPAVLAAVLLSVGAARTAEGQARNVDTERKPSQLVCSLSLFLSFQSADVIGNTVHIEGRGLTSCRNDQGFTTEAPVFADVDAKLIGPAAAGETAFSMNSSAFVIPRELNQITDIYETRDFSWSSANKETPTILFRGRQHDLVLEAKLASVTTSIRQLQIESMRIRFDESAPDLQ